MGDASLPLLSDDSSFLFSECACILHERVVQAEIPARLCEKYHHSSLAAVALTQQYLLNPSSPQSRTWKAGRKLPPVPDALPLPGLRRHTHVSRRSLLLAASGALPTKGMTSSISGRLLVPVGVARPSPRQDRPLPRQTLSAPRGSVVLRSSAPTVSHLFLRSLPSSPVCTRSGAMSAPRSPASPS